MIGLGLVMSMLSVFGECLVIIEENIRHALKCSEMFSSALHKTWKITVGTVLAVAPTML